MMTEWQYDLYNIALVLLFMLAWAIPVSLGFLVYYLIVFKTHSRQTLRRKSWPETGSHVD